MQRQYYDYVDSDGKRKTFLLLPIDYKEVDHYQSVLDWSIRQCFERQTGIHNAREVVLTLDRMDKATTL